MRRNRKGEAHIHAGGIPLDRRVEKSLGFGEGNDLVELAADFMPCHSEDCPVKMDILASSQFRVKARTHLKQACYPTAQSDPSLGRLGDTAEDLQKGALAGAITADNADDLAFTDLE